MILQKTEVKKYRLALSFFIFGLVISGLTALPLETELRLFCKLLGIDDPNSYHNLHGMSYWAGYISYGLTDTYAKYPFFGYGTDWLAFGHIVIALFFIKPLLQPADNLWVLQYGLYACLAVIPFALLAGAVREIPIYWRLIDCAFGILGSIPLLYCLRQAKKLGITR